MTHDITKGVELPISYSINSLDMQHSVSINSRCYLGEL